MQYLFLNSMSRNGASLLFQLLAGHREVFLYPARIVICFKPWGWPFYGYEAMRTSEFFDAMATKHIVYIGDSFQTLKRSCIKDTRAIDYDRLRRKFFKSVTAATVDVATMPQCYAAFCNSFVLAFGDSAAAALREAKYLVFQEDHLFNIGPSCILSHFPNSLFVHIIRNMRDVLASRKRLLLIFRGYRGDPRLTELRQQVLEAEATRWMWSVLCAHLNYQSAPDRYVIVRFESLRSEREKGMRSICEKTGIAYDSVLLSETKAAPNVFAINSLLETDTTLGLLTQGRSTVRVGAHVETLSDNEQAAMERIEAEWSSAFGRELESEDALSEVRKFCDLNKDILNANPIIARWVNYRRRGQLDLLLAEYNGLDYGRRELGRAFIE